MIQALSGLLLLGFLPIMAALYQPQKFLPPKVQHELILRSQPPPLRLDLIRELDELVELEHQARPGETLSSIAKIYGTNAASLRGVNHLENPRLTAGQKIRVINKIGLLHTVKSGETLPSIAKRYGRPVAEIEEANGLEEEEPGTGERLFIPKAVIYFREFGWPLRGRLTSRFGMRWHPIHKRRIFHEGMDLRASYKFPVRASREGRVRLAGYNGGYGKAVILSHADGFQTLYGHLHSIGVRRGQRVEKGQFLGREGSTGGSTGHHLHFEILRYGRPVNPLKYLQP